MLLECLLGLTILTIVALQIVTYTQISIQFYNRLVNNYSSIESMLNNIALEKNGYKSVDTTIKNVTPSINAIISSEDETFELLVIE